MGERARVVAALISRPGPEFLIQKRPPTSPRGGLWEFPGGKVEPGESDADALVREIREELGCEIEVHERVGENQHDYPDVSLQLILYRCAPVKGEPAPREGQTLFWAPWEAIAALSFAEADVPFLPLLRTEGLVHSK